MTVKVIVLGGAGEMGSRAAQDFVVSKTCSRVTLADKNEEAAASVAKTLAKENVTVDVLPIDAFDHEKLVQALGEYDVIAGALGPFHIFESRLIDAAIEAGVNYCSICDEWEPAEQVIEQFHEKAKEKGVTIITGLGASPGLTNLGIGLLAQELDRIDKAQIAVYLPLNCGAQGAALRHGLYIMSGQTAIWRNGQRTMIKACSKKQSVQFPQFGPLPCWNMGHSEPVTIPRYLQSIKDVDFYMGFGTGTAPICQMARWGWFAGKKRSEFFAKATEFVEGLGGETPPGAGAVRLDVWGEKNGEAAHRVLCGTGMMREITGLNLSVGTIMSGQGRLTATGGVFAPEGCLDPREFLAELKARGIVAYRDVEMKTPVA